MAYFIDEYGNELDDGTPDPSAWKAAPVAAVPATTYYENNGQASSSVAAAPATTFYENDGASSTNAFDLNSIREALSIAGVGSASSPTASVPDAPPKLTAEPSWLDGIMGKLSTAYNKNPDKFWEVGLGAIAGAYKDEQATKAKGIEHDRAMQKLAQENQYKLDAQEKVNSSFVGMPKARGGIISGALKRTNGTPVFTNGNINKA